MLLLFPVAALADGNTGGIHGFVREHHWGPRAHDTPVAGATVALWQGNTERLVKTDAHGFYVVFGLAPGLYEMIASNGAFTTNPLFSERDVCVHAGSMENVNLLVVPRNMADYDYEYAIRQRYLERFEPDTSQTADLYSIGDC